MNKVFRAVDPIKGFVKVGEETEIDGKRYFIKKVKRAKHFFRLIDGYAIQRNVFLKLVDLGFEGIYITETDTKTSLYASIKTWQDDGSVWTGKSGKQQTLSERYMINLNEVKRQEEED